MGQEAFYNIYFSARLLRYPIYRGQHSELAKLIENQGKKRDIQNLFIEAVSYATDNKIANPFWFEKETVTQVLTDMKMEIKKELSTEEFEFVAQILKVDTKHGMNDGFKHHDDLTEREKEVLNELAQESSNKDPSHIVLAYNHILIIRNKL